MTRHEEERLQRLNRRRLCLLVRIKDSTKLDLTFDKAEASALDWAISKIRALEKENAEMRAWLKG